MQTWQARYLCMRYVSRLLGEVQDRSRRRCCLSRPSRLRVDLAAVRRGALAAQRGPRRVWVLKTVVARALHRCLESLTGRQRTAGVLGQLLCGASRWRLGWARGLHRRRDCAWRTVAALLGRLEAWWAIALETCETFDAWSQSYIETLEL